MKQFVPKNLGFSHITRNGIIDRHTSSIAQHLMCDDEPDTAILICDGTYIYIQVREKELLRS